MPRICCQIHALTIRSDFFFTAAPFCLCVRSASINSFKLGNVPGIINLYSRILSPFQIINKFNSWLFLFFIQLPYKFIVFANQFCSDFYSMLHMACNDFSHRTKPFFLSGFWRLYYMVIALYIGFVLISFFMIINHSNTHLSLFVAPISPVKKFLDVFAQTVFIVLNESHSDRFKFPCRFMRIPFYKSKHITSCTAWSFVPLHKFIFCILRICSCATHDLKIFELHIGSSISFLIFRALCRVLF